ncbi:MAG TPA: class I SAM-dependent methyltransferase [Acidimicrobiales bacterium]|nr:class I SAM-dependent methyltransferase [Acidimicrobiales bacterium]
MAPAKMAPMLTPPHLPDAPGWLLDELARAGKENLDADHVARYDLKEDAGATAEVALLQRLGLDHTSLVVELGTGTGQFAMAVAPYCERVVAVDISPPMLSRLRDKAAQGPTARLKVVQAGFLSYDHKERPADIVYSRYALHHLPDFWKAVALARVHTILRTGGVFRLWDVVYNFEPSQAQTAVEAWCSSGGSSPGEEWTRAELEEHVREEHSTYTWLLEAMIERTGFAIEDAEYSDNHIFAKYVLRRL